MNLFAEIRDLVVSQLDAMVAAGDLPPGLDMAAVVVEPPRDAAHGEMATNAAPALARQSGQPPRRIAQALAARLTTDLRVQSAAAAGPGFVNLRLHAAVWQTHIATILQQGGDYGRSAGNGRRVHIAAFASQPDAPMPPVQIRTVVLADSLARLLTFAGYDTTAELLVTADQDSTLRNLRHELALLGPDLYTTARQTMPADPAKIASTIDRLQAKLAATHLPAQAATCLEDIDFMGADGAWGALALDINQQHDLYLQGFDDLIAICPADQIADEKRLKAAIAVLSDGRCRLDIRRLSHVTFAVSQAVPAATPCEVFKQIGRDMARFALLLRKNDMPLHLDAGTLGDPSSANPAFNVQYAHARIAALRRQHPASDDSIIKDADLRKLDHPAELALIRTLATWPTVVAISAMTREPHRIVIYLNSLATRLHDLANRSHDTPSLRVTQDDLATSCAKIALSRACGVVICNGLAILAVTPVEEMR